MPKPLPPNASIALACVALGCGTRGETERAQQAEPTAPLPEASSTDVSPSTTPTATATVSPPTPAGTDTPNAVPPQLEQCVVGEVAGSAEDRALMEPFVVHHGQVARRTLYSWTTAEQIEELRADPTLLTRSMTSEGERGRASDVILEHAATDPLAALLARPEYEKKRFAWSNPWATLLGWSGEGYGDRLLGITLREEAWIGRLLLDSSNVVDWAFFDTQGNLVDSAEVLSTPERLAAVYFVDARDPSACRGSLQHTGSVLREYFICNESMVERWEAFTPALAAELDRGIGALEALVNSLQSAECEVPFESPACWRERVVTSWGTEPADATQSELVPLYEASLALPNDLYRPSIRNLQYLLQTLRQVPRDEAASSYDYPSLEQETDGGSPR